MDMDSPQQENGHKLVYMRDQLLTLRTTARVGIVPHLPQEVRRPYQGCRTGTKVKARHHDKWWRYKPSVPG